MSTSIDTTDTISLEEVVDSVVKNKKAAIAVGALEVLAPAMKKAAELLDKIGEERISVHAGEMRGAAMMVESWAEGLKDDFIKTNR